MQLRVYVYIYPLISFFLIEVVIKVFYICVYIHKNNLRAQSNVAETNIIWLQLEFRTVLFSTFFLSVLSVFENRKTK